MHNQQHRTVMMNGTYDVQVCAGHTKEIYIDLTCLIFLINVSIIHTSYRIQKQLQ